MVMCLWQVDDTAYASVSREHQAPDLVSGLRWELAEERWGGCLTILSCGSHGVHSSSLERRRRWMDVRSYFIGVVAGRQRARKRASEENNQRSVSVDWQNAQTHRGPTFATKIGKERAEKWTRKEPASGSASINAFSAKLDYIGRYSLIWSTIIKKAAVSGSYRYLLEARCSEQAFLPICVCPSPSSKTIKGHHPKAER